MKRQRGYKESEAGMIPVDWNMISLADCSTKIGSGITPTGGIKVYKSSGRPFIRSQNVGSGYLILDDVAFIDDATHADFKNTEIKKDDVLLNITGASIGRCAIVNDDIVGGNVNQHVCVIRTRKEILNPKLLCEVLLSDYGQNFINSFQSGGNRQGLNFGQIKTFNVPIPPTKAEQNAIAKALYETDELIGELEKLIAKKENVKLATMQQLLTGKKRLDGYRDKWEICKLGAVAHVSIGQSPNSKNYNNQGEGLPLIQGKADIIERRSISRIWTTEITKICDKGDLILTVRAPVGHIAISSDYSCIGRGVCALKPVNGSCSFLYQLLIFIESKWKALEQGSTFTSANSNQINNLQICLPVSQDEQYAIGKVLEEMDIEIKNLKIKLLKYQSVKQGMMQSLLTGKVRLTD